MGAAGGVARVYGSASLFGGDTGSTGSLVFKQENRHKLGTDIAPQSLGFQTGYVGLTSLTYSDVDWVLTNLYWQQSSKDNRFAFVAGITDTTDYVDVCQLGNPWAEFSNHIFSTNPTIPVPDQGSGAAISAHWGQNGYVLAGIADANGDPGDPGNPLSSFFETGEYFSHVEVGWVSSWENRFRDNIHLTLWHSDPRSAIGVPNGHGAALSASWKTSERLTPFARIGYADGGGSLLDRSANFGVGITPKRTQDQIGIGVNWGRPIRVSYATTSTQTAIEAYYRWQALDWLKITPDIQYVSNPALNPGAPSIWYLGLRIRAVF